MSSKKHHNGLGKGLAALISEDIHFDENGSLESEPQSENTHQDGGLIVELPIGKIRPNKEQPRKHFDQRALEELATSIKEHGVLQPLVVKKEEGAYTIIAGERRWRAATLAGLDTIPVIVKDLSDREVVEIALIENVQREDLNPIEEAMAFEQLSKEYNLTQGEIGIRIGKSRAAVTNVMRLLKLPVSVRQMVLKNQLSGGHARALLGLEDGKMMEALAKKAIERNWSVREMEDAVRRVKHPRKPKAQKNKDPYLVDVEDQLSKHLGASVKLTPKNKKGSGKITIDYASTDDLNRILELIK
jgi:ParB family chromosome partitioning protein